VIGRTVVMPACTPRLERELRARGFDPVVVDVSEFLKAGGGPRCLTLALDVRIGVQDTAEVAGRYTAHNYDPLAVTVTHAEGAWVHDDRGRRYLDALSAYSALNFGHRHPRLVAAAHEQLERVTLTSRAFSNDQLGPFARELAALCGKDRVLPMNTGAEAVETAIKAARKWGYDVKGVRPGRATILVCDGNFHGRTTTIVSFSDDPLARDGFGPFTPGFARVPFGDAAALSRALRDDADVVAFLVEPVQGEAGVIVPPDGYLREARRLCSQHGVLLIADEIQSGLGRTGRTFACDHEDVVPDVYVLGKALGGGILALSAIVADDAVLGVFSPGSHGSTFGGNPLACAVGRAVLELLATGEPQANAARTGARLRAGLDAAPPAALSAIRSRGLWFGLDLDPAGPSARTACERLLGQGVLAKDTHGHTIRLAPPLTISVAEADWLLERVLAVLGDAHPLRLAATATTPPPRPASFAA
jgi:ornithine--oxo-acid transaminase